MATVETYGNEGGQMVRRLFGVFRETLPCVMVVL